MPPSRSSKFFRIPSFFNGAIKTRSIVLLCANHQVGMMELSRMARASGVTSMYAVLPLRRWASSRVGDLAVYTIFSQPDAPVIQRLPRTQERGAEELGRSEKRSAPVPRLHLARLRASVRSAVLAVGNGHGKQGAALRACHRRGDDIATHHVRLRQPARRIEPPHAAGEIGARRTPRNSDPTRSRPLAPGNHQPGFFRIPWLAADSRWTFDASSADRPRSRKGAQFPHGSPVKRELGQASHQGTAARTLVPVSAWHGRFRHDCVTTPYPTDSRFHRQ